MGKLTFHEIEEYLGSSKADWKKRTDSLTKLRDLLDKGDGAALDFVCKHANLFALQINDLRSAIGKQTGEVVESLVRAAENKKFNYLDKFTEIYLRNTNVVKALGSANTVINMHATSAFQALFDGDCVALSTIEQFYATNHKNKNHNVREKVAMGVFLFINNVVSNGQRKVRYDDLNFFKRALDKLAADANVDVREWAKRGKSEYARLEDAINGGGFAEKDSKDGDLMDTRTKSISRDKKRKVKNKSKVKKPKKKDNTGGIQSKTTPIKGFGEHKTTVDSSEKILSKTKDSQGYLKKRNRQDKYQLTVFEILEDPKMKVKEKFDKLEKLNLEEYTENCDFEEYKKLLSLYQYMKNYELKKFLVDLLESVSIVRFLNNLLAYAEKEKMDKKTNYRFFIERLMQEELMEFIEFFILRGTPFSIRMLIKRFNNQEFDEIVEEQQELLESIFGCVNQNISEAKNEAFMKANVKLLEMIFENEFILEQGQEYEFYDEVYEFFEDVNPRLYQDLGHQRKSPPKVEKKIIRKKSPSKKPSPVREPSPQYESESESEEEEPIRNNYVQTTIKREASPHRNQYAFEQQKVTKKHHMVKKEKTMVTTHTQEDRPRKPSYKLDSGFNSEENVEGNENRLSKIESLMQKANNETKKTVIKSILKHIDSIGDKRDQYSLDGIYNKTFEILRCTIESDELDDQLAQLCCKLIEEIYSLSEQDKTKLNSLYELILKFLATHLEYNELLIEYLISSSVRSDFFLFLVDNVDSSSPGLVIRILKTLTLMLKMGKSSYSYNSFHKEFISEYPAIRQTIKHHFSHKEVGIRKNVVQFIVQCRFFLDSNMYKKIISDFSFEQKKLIEIYVKKRMDKP